jgi:hypothetical protein
MLYRATCLLLVCGVSVLLVKPSSFVSYIKSPPLSDAASYKASEKISFTQDTLLLRIIRWYILSTIWMLEKNSVVSHQQLADYTKLRMIYSICGPAFLNEHRKATRTIVHIW